MTFNNMQVSFDSGNDQVLRYEVKSGTDATSPPLDLTGATAQWSLSQYIGQTNNIYETSLLEKCTNLPADTITIIDAANGIVHVSLSSVETRVLSGRYYHQLRIISSAGIADVVAVGTVNIAESVVTVC